eukprot:CAMPEP_0185260786 /NCGR_PEP_ID=MMETSP1359-20130426/9334_1 /TAXON_ID=552665 /ORGANISM="Bigelowiella longifila, Strain CCMP242" /LENGTH=212 /DNA_ID=CAMNT_0027847199 /DNA_START=606 /DNA_END=1244 /DNA_ORIENTATION=+
MHINLTIIIELREEEGKEEEEEEEETQANGKGNKEGSAGGGDEVRADGCDDKGGEKEKTEDDDSTAPKKEGAKEVEAKQGKQPLMINMGQFQKALREDVMFECDEAALASACSKLLAQAHCKENAICVEDFIREEDGGHLSLSAELDTAISFPKTFLSRLIENFVYVNSMADSSSNNGSAGSGFKQIDGVVTWPLFWDIARVVYYRFQVAPK